jgi:hypothetical protein
MPAPNDQGIVHLYYQRTPLGIAVLESVLQIDIPIFYSEGYHDQKLSNGS